MWFVVSQHPWSVTVHFNKHPNYVIHIVKDHCARVLIYITPRCIVDRITASVFHRKNDCRRTLQQNGSSEKRKGLFCPSVTLPNELNFVQFRYYFFSHQAARLHFHMVTRCLSLSSSAPATAGFYAVTILVPTPQFIAMFTSATHSKTSHSSTQHEFRGRGPENKLRPTQNQGDFWIWANIVLGTIYTHAAIYYDKTSRSFGV